MTLLNYICANMKFKRRRIFIFLAMSASLLMITPFCLFAFSQPSRFYIRTNEHPDIITTVQGSISNEGESKSNEGTKKCSEEQELPRCEVVHICIVCTGFSSTRDVVTLLKSLIFHRKNRLHLHFLSDQVATKILQVFFETWMVPAVAVTFYDTENLKDKVEWIPNKHYSGINGLMKLLIPEVLPAHLGKVIVLDTDTTLMADIGELWKVFLRFNKEQAIGLVDNQSNWYLQKGGGVQVWPALGTGYNTGVILFNLNVTRSLGWNSLWSEVTRKYLVELHVVYLADQDVFNAVINDNSYLVHNISCSWNVQLGEKTLSDICYTKSDPKIIHWNSPKKLKVKAKNVEHFRNLFLTFLEYNGNLLRQDFLVTCSDDVTQVSPSTSSSSSSLTLSYLHQNPPKESDDVEECEDFYRERLMKRRTHLYYLDYSTSLMLFLTSSSSISSSSPVDITLVAQLSMDRMQMLDMMASAWQGPISLALYLSDAEVHQLLKFVQGSAVLGSRRNIGYHVVFKDGQYYPINYLRNVALQNVNTRFAFLSDIDFLPLTDLYDRLRHHVVDLDLTNQKRALVIPAFETERYKVEYPSSKAQLLSMLDARELFTFRYHVWPQGQLATNYTRWKETNDPYQVSWEPNYEPFIVIDRSAPKYDERFLGFGWNKVSHIMELDAMGYEFWVVPDSFILHLPHSPSLDIARYRSSESYRYCLRQLKEDFLKDLSRKYGLKALKYLSPDN